jgi:hypothetical protein
VGILDGLIAMLGWGMRYQSISRSTDSVARFDNKVNSGTNIGKWQLIGNSTGIVYY